MRKHKGGFDTFSLSDYTITQDGEIINNKWKRKVKPQPNGKGYLRVHIAGHMHFVHRLVAEKYIPNPDGKPQVNHKDGNKTNNHASNLEWVSNAENRAHAVSNGLQVSGERCPCAKLTRDKVGFIRQHTELTSEALAGMFGVSSGTIRSVRRFESWK